MTAVERAEESGGRVIEMDNDSPRLWTLHLVGGAQEAVPLFYIFLKVTQRLQCVPAARVCLCALSVGDSSCVHGRWTHTCTVHMTCEVSVLHQEKHFCDFSILVV